MYLEHFGLKAFPFSTAPDPRFYYPSAKHREALACLLYAVEQRKGFALITGEVGSGKSMLCRAALARLGESVEAAMVAHTSLSPEEFIRAAIAEFGIEESGKSKVQLLREFRDFLVAAHRRGRGVVLIVDEAQDLSPQTLEEVRLLGNLETATDKLVQIVLVGQPELRRMIGTYALRQLDQRIAVKFHLGNLTYKDVDAYIEHRMRIAGAPDASVFDADAKFEIFKASGGVPRLINVTCDQALLQAYVQDERKVSAETARRVVSEREGYYMDRTGQVVQDEQASEAVRGDLRVRKARVKCPQCHTTVGVYEDEAGQSGVCPGCGSIIKIPADAFPGSRRTKQSTGASGARSRKSREQVVPSDHVG